MGFKIEDKTQDFTNKTMASLGAAISRMAIDIKQISNIRVPFKKGELQKSSNVERITDTHQRVWYDAGHAAIQERGSRLDGSHQIKKYSTAGTGKDFLKDAGRSVADNSLNYLKQAASLVRV